MNENYNSYNKENDSNTQITNKKSHKWATYTVTTFFILILVYIDKYTFGKLDDGWILMFFLIGILAILVSCLVGLIADDLDDRKRKK